MSSLLERRTVNGLAGEDQREVRLAGESVWSRRKQLNASLVEMHIRCMV